MSFHNAKFVSLGGHSAKAKLHPPPLEGSSLLPAAVSLSPGRLDGMVPLCCPQHTRAQEVEVRTPIHLPLDRFQAIALPFNWTISPRILQGRRHRLLLLANANGKGT